MLQDTSANSQMAQQLLNSYPLLTSLTPNSGTTSFLFISFHLNLGLTFLGPLSLLSLRNTDISPAAMINPLMSSLMISTQQAQMKEALTMSSTQPSLFNLNLNLTYSPLSNFFIPSSLNVSISESANLALLKCMMDYQHVTNKVKKS